MRPMHGYLRQSQDGRTSTTGVNMWCGVPPARPGSKVWGWRNTPAARDACARTASPRQGGALT